MANTPLCPICKKTLAADRGPQVGMFCSERCRLIDLGNWLGGKYTIAGDERVSQPGKRDEEDPT